MALKNLWLITLLTLLLFALAFQGSRGLYSPDEGRYVDVALEMLQTGDWIHPRLHHEVAHFTKPPLTYWVLAASSALFGMSEWALRLPYALAWFATALLVFGIGRSLKLSRPWLPALVWCSFLLPYLAAHIITTDTLLALFTTFYSYTFIKARTTPVLTRRWVICMWLGAALAFLTKGPPGLLPLLGLLIFALCERDHYSWRDYFPITGLLVFFVIGFSWYIKVALDQPALVRYFFVEEIWHRLSSDHMHRNAQWYNTIRIYGPSLLLGALPWSGVLLCQIWRAISAPQATWSYWKTDTNTRMLLYWFFIPFCVFLLSKSRLPFYVLPLFVPLALSISHALNTWSFNKTALSAVLFWMFILASICGVAAYWTHPKNDRALAFKLKNLPIAHIDEVAFVETEPRYGLRFYLGAEVERLSISATRLPLHSQSLKSEIDEAEGCRLLLVQPKHAEQLQQALLALHQTYQKYDRIGDFIPFAQQPNCTPEKPIK